MTVMRHIREEQILHLLVLLYREIINLNSMLIKYNTIEIALTNKERDWRNI